MNAPLRPLALFVIAAASLSCTRGAPSRAPAPPAESTRSVAAAPTAAAQPPIATPPSEGDPDDGPADDGGRGWLGVELAVNPQEQPGVLVRSVVPGSPAERAGLIKGDVVVSIDGQTVARPSDIVSLVASHHAGDRVAIALLRGHEPRLFAATLEPVPNDESLLKRRYVDSAAPALGDLKTVRGSVNPSLSELRGNVVLVEFWAGWCVPCRITAPLLSSWSDRYSAEGLRVLGVTNDTVVEAADAAQRHGMTYPVFSDETGATTLSYRAFALPTLFVIDRRGVVRDVVVGFSTSRLKEVEGLLERLLAER